MSPLTNEIVVSCYSEAASEKIVHGGGGDNNKKLTKFDWPPFLTG